MKTTKELKIWSLRMVLFTILLSGLSVQKVYSFCNSTEIIIAYSGAYPFTFR